MAGSSALMIKMPCWMDLMEQSNRENHLIMDDVIKKAAEAVNFIKIQASVKKQVFCAFSGGKDSLATYYLMKKALGSNFKVVFNNTGLEFPEMYAFIKKFVAKEHLGDRFIQTRPLIPFFKLIKKYRLHRGNYRHCCWYLKEGPAVTYFRSQGTKKTNAIEFVGTRKRESRNRKKQERIDVFKKNLFRGKPIFDWTENDVYIYLGMIGAELNPLYDHYKRLGCWACINNNGFFAPQHKMFEKKWKEIWNLKIKTWKI